MNSKDILTKYPIEKLNLTKGKEDNIYLQEKCQENYKNMLLFEDKNNKEFEKAAIGYIYSYIRLYQKDYQTYFNKYKELKRKIEKTINKIESYEIFLQNFKRKLKTFISNYKELKNEYKKEIPLLNIKLDSLKLELEHLKKQQIQSMKFDNTSEDGKKICIICNCLFDGGEKSRYCPKCIEIIREQFIYEYNKKHYSVIDEVDQTEFICNELDNT